MLRQGIAASRRAASWCTRRSFASKPKKPVVLNDYTRVRDLAKKLKVSADDVVKQACRKHYHKYYMTHHDIQYKFDSLKQVILPLDLAARIADHFGATVAYESVEPQDIESDPSLGVLVPRPPVIAVMGHVDHGKTTLMDTLRGANIAQFEVEKITQKIHVCDTTLAPDVPVTFLDTPGHFHFTRMRNNAAGVADAVVLVVAADEGCRLQTDESIGCIEDLDVPTVVCVNKMDLVPPSTFDKICDEIKEYVALETSPVLPISAKEGTNLDVLKQTLLNVLETQVLTMHAHVDRGTQGTTLEVVASIGRGTVLRILVQHGALKVGDHFICGMLHGVVKNLTRANGDDVAIAMPGQVVDVSFKKLSRHKDAPLEYSLHVVTKERAEAILHQREMAMDFEASVELRPDQIAEKEKEEARLPAKGFVGTPIVVKADTAGSLTSILDTVDDMAGIHTAHMGLGNITVKDVERGCTIFGFNVRLHARERKLAAEQNVRIVIRPTIHQLLEEIALVADEDEAIADDADENQQH
ncbi:hypothetical protein H310_15304 [Aphanomyces invadans]|uniref:Tr-type G domain-containing protein n=1 Tax=Aphanomyces invadans TaxID=157072 RepID=A0A024T952_9STRA|nr:hypothetical protein H310_15304 [Aphanomyces invadans]ETV89857.1 hypothetical protein H310_15304 [Aphanomyces invadans]|eukprot:XP_008881510.1 hypothetical protein H310_15304 [Aphanomyces invadans]